MTAQQDDIARALLDRDTARLKRVLARCPNPREVLATHPRGNLLWTCRDTEHRDAIPVLAAYMPEWLEERREGKTLFLTAAQNQDTKSMLALARAGADVHATDDEFEDNALSAALRGMFPVLGNWQQKYAAIDHLLALRSLGIDINGVNKFGQSIPSDALKISTANQFIPLLHAGANLYAALGLPVPEDPFHPDINGIKQAFLRHSDKPDGSFEATQLELFLGDATIAAPQMTRHRLRQSYFFNHVKKKEPDNRVFLWESAGLLPHYFSPQAVEKECWQGGIKAMVQTARRLPAYLQDTINLPRTLRELDTPRTGSVTVDYLHGATAGRDRA